MKADQTKHKQISIFNSLSTFSDRQINWLVSTWAFTFRLFVYPFIRPERFDCLFSSADSRPATSPQVTVSLLIIQAIFKKTDDEMHNWMMGADIALRFATDTLDCSDENLPTSDKQLSRFQMRCKAYADSHDGENPMDNCLHQVGYGMCALMGTDLTKVRMDAARISENMVRLNRESRIYSANLRMLNHLLAQNDPKQKEAIEKEGLCHYFEADDRNKALYYSHIGKGNRRKALSEEAGRILKICKEEDLESEEGRQFTESLSELTVVGNGGRRVVTGVEGIRASRNDADPDAAARQKAEKEFIGYVRDLAETVGTDENRIISWDFEQNAVNDPVMEMAFLQEAGEILSGIESCNRLLGLEPPEDMERCQRVLQEKMQIVRERIREAVRSGRKVPRAMKPEPLDEKKKDSEDSSDGNTQLTMDDLLRDLGISTAGEQTESPETKETTTD
ncbi:MAG: hypothetical protein IJ088_15765 [Clostridia bacterium]|nr:hypothetical protein [Clostridia bacterium]